MSLHFFGVRHHGPGSARSLLSALQALEPDAILVEGPPDADELLPLAGHSDMRPPVALLLYVPDQPQRAVYYPFAAFSPEWQAIRYGLAHDAPLRFMDLPQAHWMALPPPGDEPSLEPPADPIALLAEAAGYSDGERWWEHAVEQRRDSAGLFAAIQEAMTALRDEAAQDENPLQALREAYMRRTIRAARRQGFERIAVVCGAWHAPALSDAPPLKADRALLKGLPKVKVQAAWVPWTYGRLSFASGYGAGVVSPGWYHHLWQCSERALGPAEVAARWLTRVARLLRGEDLDASSAHVIEAVRLAQALAALRDRPLSGLPELNEATQTVLCFGSDVPMRLIQHKLTVGERLGQVPNETPMVPLQQDLQREQRRLRLRPQATGRTLDLDLRKPMHLGRSHLLHRLALLGVPWGEREEVTGKKGTFHELWRLEWQPDSAILLIEASMWGNTLPSAATARAQDAADRASALPDLTHLLDGVILADLPEAVSHLMARLQEQTALSSDVGHLMQALPPLVNVLRYGNVRQTDTEMVAHVVDGLVVRVCIGLPGACASLDDDAARGMFEQLLAANSALALLQDAAHLAAWQGVLEQMADQKGLHGLLAGRCCRLLLDCGRFDSDEAARRLGLALSTASEPPQAAAWVEGFLRGSGLLLLHDDALWQALDDWVMALPGETFTTLLPLLRRTFATFVPAERRQIGARVRQGPARDLAQSISPADFDTARAKAVLPVLRQLLGLENESHDA
jgi:hypothetical protein